MTRYSSVITMSSFTTDDLAGWSRDWLRDGDASFDVL